MVEISVSQPPGRGPVPGPGINYTGLQHIVINAMQLSGGELTPLSCIACMTICCSVHKSALTYKGIIFSTFSNQ